MLSETTSMRALPLNSFPVLRSARASQESPRPNPIPYTPNPALHSRKTARPTGLDLQQTPSLQPQTEPLLVLAAKDRQARKISHLLQPIADGVPVGVEVLGRLGEVLVVGEISAERVEQLTVVLLVVTFDGIDGLEKQRAQLVGIMFPDAEQQLVRAHAVELHQTAPSLQLPAHLQRRKGLLKSLAKAVEIVGVPAYPDGDR